MLLRAAEVILVSGQRPKAIAVAVVAVIIVVLFLLSTFF